MKKTNHIKLKEKETRDEKTKSEILAEYLYKAILRWNKKAGIPERKSHFRLDSERVWRGNSDDK